MDLVQRHVPATRDDEHDAGLLVAQEYLHSLGVTAWQDAILGVYAGNADPASAYLRAVRGGHGSPPGCAGALWWERDARPRAGGPARSSGGRRTPGGRFDAGSVKVMQDGVVENYTAALSRPYRRRLRRPARTTAACPSSTREVLRDAVTRLDAEGFQVHVHAIGDRAVREALDAFEAARDGERAPPRAPPHRAPPGRGARGPAAVRGARRDRQHAGAVGGAATRR